jgi:hypothetical protein
MRQFTFCLIAVCQAMLVSQTTFADAALSSGPNSYSLWSTVTRPLETASSHGEIGGSIGLGFSDYGTADAESNESSRINQIQIVRGTSMPVDIAATIAHDPETSVTGLAGSLQWSVYEGFQTPSFCLRTGVGTQFGDPKTFVDSGHVEVATSYDLFSFIAVYGTFTHARFRVTETLDTESLAVQPGEDELTSFHTARKAAFGMVFKPIPPYLSVAGELSRDDAGASSISAKIAIGM